MGNILLVEIVWQGYDNYLSGRDRERKREWNYLHGLFIDMECFIK